jgi:DNA polymerase III delta subunit
MTKSSSSIYLFHGEDDFSLRQKINVWKQEFIKKYTASGIVQISGDSLSEHDTKKKLEEVLAPSLFSSKKLIVARNCLPTKANQEVLIETISQLLKSIPSDFFLIFWQDSLDRRLGFTKNLLKEINVVEFNLPHGLELNSWIKRQASQLNLNMDNAAIEKLAVLAGRDLFEEKKAGGRVIERKEFFDLWQIRSELEKLATFSNTITSKEVGEMVPAKVSENVFALSDAIVSQNKKMALEILEHLMSEDNTDEKSMAIKLLGLISEQVRSQLVVSVLKAQNMDQNQIANFLGWSPGRVFITLRNSANSRMDKLKSLLANLLSADALVKSTDSNPKLLIDLLITN